MADVVIQIWDVLSNQFLKHHCRRRGGEGQGVSGEDMEWACVTQKVSHTKAQWSGVAMCK